MLPTALTVQTKNAAILRVILGTFILFVTSQISIPLHPVPITMQTVGVLLIALTYERKEALASVTSFLTLGCIGAPVFADFSGGIQHLIGPTGGYLVGFFVATLVLTSMPKLRANANFFYQFGLQMLGTALIFACGLTWLATQIGWDKAIQFGFMPFIVPGIAKALALGGILSYVRAPKA